MTVVSVSLNDDNIESLDEIQSVLKLSGRSEAIRASIRAAESEIREMKELDGIVEGVLIIVHGDHGDIWMGQIQHRYEAIIKTQLHSHLKDRKCLDVMIISSESGTIKEMMTEVHSVGKADYIKFVRS